MPGYEASGWLGIGAPKATPADVIASLNQAVNEDSCRPGCESRMSISAQRNAENSADFGKLMEEDVAKWADVIHSANIKLEQ